MIMKQLAALAMMAAIGCGGGAKHAPAEPAAGSAMAVPVAADNFCEVVAQVMEAAKEKFATVASVAPTGAKAEMANGPITVSWTASWKITETPEEGLAKLKARVMACPFAARLTGGEPHATEKGGKLTAIDWKDAQTASQIEIVSEGGGEASLVVVPM